MQKFFILILLLHSSTCFEHYCAHLQEDNCINTTSGIVTLFGWLFSTQLRRGLSYDPGVDSGSNINEYQEHFLGGKGGRCVRLTTLPLSCAIVTWDLPLALQPTVGFGLSNNVLPFFPICHQLSASSHSQHLKISFYFLFPSFPGSSLLLVPSSSWVTLFLGILSSSILSSWPNQLILCPFIHFTIFSPLLISSSSWFVRLFHSPFSYLGPYILLNIFLSKISRACCSFFVNIHAVMKSGNLNFLVPSGPLQACNGTALPFYVTI